MFQDDWDTNREHSVEDTFTITALIPCSNLSIFSTWERMFFQTAKIA